MNREIMGIATSLRKSALDLGNVGGPTPIGKLKVEFPFSEIAYAPWDQPISRPVYESYVAMRELHTPEEFPQTWIPLVAEANTLRKRNGVVGAANPVLAAFFVLHDNTELAAQNGIGLIPEISENDSGFKDKKVVRDKVDAIIACPELKDRLLRTMATLVPDESVCPIDHEPVVELINARGLQGGVLADLGCGTGYLTNKWAHDSGMRAFGMERQMHPCGYDTNWRDPAVSANFTQADVARLPLPDESVDLAIMEAVVPHVTKAGLMRVLVEAKRTLKPETGILAVAPQDCEWRGKDTGNGNWRYFIKSEECNNETALRKVNYFDLIK